MHMKSYKLFLESNTKNKNIVQFLISKERENKGLYFDDYEIIDDLIIKANTKIGPNGEVPIVDEVIYDIIDIKRWEYKSNNVSSYNEFDIPMRIKMDILSSIISHEQIEKNKPITDNQKRIIDKIFNEENAFDKIYTKSELIIKSIRRYDIEDIEDRLIEFSDNLIGWDPSVSHSTYIDSGWIIIANNESILSLSNRIMFDAFYHIERTHNKMEFDEYINSIKPCIFIKLNNTYFNHKRFSSKYVSGISANIIKRFKLLYDIDYVIDDYGSKIDTEIIEYQITMILNT